MFFTAIILINLLVIAAEQIQDIGFCEIGDKSCSDNLYVVDEKLLFYDVNPSEGFNLRRDVYMRFAIMLAEARKSIMMLNWKLVLPPWYQLYHWRNHHSRSRPHNWGQFFDVESLKSYAPVLELHEAFSKTSLGIGKPKPLQIDTLYVLQNYADPFESGTFVEKWEEDTGACHYDGQYWGYKNITAKEIICVKFQGKISMLSELISLHPKATKIMFAHGEIPLHDSYGTKSYWDCRKSMKFNSKLVETAKVYIKNHLDCTSDRCNDYLGVHWRRQDFSQSRQKDVPSIEGTAEQIHAAIRKNSLKVRKIFIASDASKTEKDHLEKLITSYDYNYKVYFYAPSQAELNEFTDAGVAIIDQIICSRAAYFVGTHESTFSFRIQEEREILGFNPSSTFNRLCPDRGRCEKVSKWTIVQ